MDVAQSKLLAIISLGIGSIFVGLLPACFTKQSRKQWPLFLSSLLCFGGGVLLSTSLIHILPEVREMAQTNLKPYTELFFCMGFFILYLMDEIVHFFYGEAGHSHGHGQNESVMGFHGQSNKPGCSDTQNYERRHSTIGKHSNYGTYSSDIEERGALLRGEKQLPYNPNVFRARSDSVLFCDEPPSQLCHVMHQEPCKTTAPTANIGLLVALSVHSLLEGLAVGLEGQSSKVLLLLGAIASHKLVVGFCLGVELASSQQITFCTHFICVIVFAAASVGGILLGLVISKISSDVTEIVIPVLQSLAGGTLLYVTVSEVIPRERARWHQLHSRRVAGIAQLLSVLGGFVLMTIFIKYLDHDS